jgi:hypothetical protein
MAGFSNARSVILRCSVTGQVRGSGDTGGMVGVCWEGVLMDCLAEVQVTGVKNVGGMVGGGPGATLLRCESRGNTSGDSYVGGLIGELRQGQIVDSRAEGFVTGRDSVGGLVGSMAMAGSIMRSVADCEVTAEQTAGGLAGSAVRFAAQGQLISDCHAHGVVAGSIAGGLIGEASDVRVLNSYAACEMIPMKAQAGAVVAAVGGLLGDADIEAPPLVEGCFWDVNLSGTPVGTGSGPIYGTGLPTEQMQQQATFEQTGWDFGSTWTMSEGGYPVLQWEQVVDARQEMDAGQ